MKYVINEIELQIMLEAMKLINLEKQVNLKDDEIEIPEAVVAETVKSIEEKVLYLLRSDTSPNAETIFENTLEGSLESDTFIAIGRSILDTHKFRRIDMRKEQKNKLIQEIPESIRQLIQQLAAYEKIYEMELPEALAAEATKIIGDNILYLLRSDTESNAESIIEKNRLGSLGEDVFLETAQAIHDMHRFREIDQEIEEKNKLTEQTPESILNVMQHLAAYGNGLNDLLGSNFYSQYFLSQFLIYKANEDRFMIDSKKINKTDLYKMTYEPGKNKDEIYSKIQKVQKNHKTLFKKDSSLVTLDTAKKRMQQVIPSKHKEGTMNQSEELNVFRQHALLIVFLIYKTSYQQFLSSPTNRTVPDSKTFEEVKKTIEEFLLEHPISGVDDELFLKTVSEDTYHFALFNGLTRLSTAVLNSMSEIIDASREYDTLSMLFIIDQMIENTPAYTAEWLSKYKEMVTELDKFAKFPELQQAVLDAIEDEEGLEYSKNTMMDMFDKYDTLHQNTEDLDFTESIFKNMVKDFYTSGEGDNAYAK